jgi:hypothetical protein
MNPMISLGLKETNDVNFKAVFTVSVHQLRLKPLQYRAMPSKRNELGWIFIVGLY